MSVPRGIPLVDAANRLLAPAPADLETGTADVNGVKLAVITVRTATTTLTVMLDAAGLGNWMGVLTGLQGQMGAGLQVITEDQARNMGLNGHRPAG